MGETWRDACGRLSSPEMGETVARRSSLPRGKRSGCSKRSRVVSKRRGELVGASEWCGGGLGVEMAEKWAATAAVPF
jgi:hypothetical protein